MQREENRPGGAGNVVLNLVSLGAEVVALSRLGNDVYGKVLKDILIQEKVDVSGLLIQHDYFTPVKNRVIAENQQIVRIDHEQLISLSAELEEQIVEQIPHLLEGIQVVALSDYGKGFLTKKLLSSLIQQAQKRGIPVITDPKGTDFSKYSGSTMIKPNLGEAYAAANLSLDMPLELVAERIFEKTSVEVLLITRSESGISIFERKGQRLDFPVRVHEVKDVTGAGDTVLAMLSYALGNRLSLAEAAQLANVAAGIAIEHLGCARVTLTELAQRLLAYDVVNKVFDEDHLFALKKALKGQKIALMSISIQGGLTPFIFKSIRELSQKAHMKLLLYIRDAQPSDDSINMLASLREVEFIILNTHNFEDFCNLIKPDEIHCLENNHLLDSPDSHLARQQQTNIQNYV